MFAKHLWTRVVLVVLMVLAFNAVLTEVVDIFMSMIASKGGNVVHLGWWPLFLICGVGLTLASILMGLIEHFWDRWIGPGMTKEEWWDWWFHH